MSYSWSKYGHDSWRKTAERWDVRDALRAEIQEAEKWLTLFEQSLVDGLRISEPRVPLKPRALARRRGEIAQMRAFQVWAQAQSTQAPFHPCEVLTRQEREAGRLRRWPGAGEADVIEEREERERAQEQEKAGRARHGLRILAGGRA